MVDSVEILTNVMQADLNNLRSVSTNLSNINTTAYKSEAAYNTSFYSHLSGVPSSELSLPLISSDVVRQHSQGAMKSTGNDLHVALEGSGFFVVQADDKELYTRRGELMVDGAGRLALVSGEMLKGNGGEVFVGNEKFEINSKGEVIQNGNVIDRLEVKTLSNQGGLGYVGGGLFEATEAPVAAAENYSVLQGFVETSNVDTTKEVIRMMEVIRHFEASSKVLQAYDKAVAHTIRELGRF